MKAYTKPEITTDKNTIFENITLGSNPVAAAICPLGYTGVLQIANNYCWGNDAHVGQSGALRCKYWDDKNNGCTYPVIK